MQGYGSAPPRVGKVKGGTMQTAKPSTGLIGSRVTGPVKVDPRVIHVKAHTRVKPGKGK